MSKRVLSLFILSFFIIFGNEASILFKENKGQWNPNYAFLAELKNGWAGFTQDSIVYHWQKRAASMHGRKAITIPNLKGSVLGADDSKLPISSEVVLTFVGTSSKPIIDAILPAISKFNYFYGKDPSAWVSGVNSYHELNYKRLYPGIDMRVKAEDDHLKYEFYVSPGKSPYIIQLHYAGADSVAINSSGQLTISTPLGSIVEDKPFAFQLIDGKKTDVPCKYKLKSGDVVFDFPKGYDRNFELVIDPTLVFSTFSGSTADNWGLTGTYDDQGNGYSGGIVFGNGFPISNTSYGKNYHPNANNGYQYPDIGILKYDSNGNTLLYGTYIGGSDTDMPHSMVVNQNNELIILGSTASIDFPSTTGAYSTSFNGGSNFVAMYSETGYYNGSDIFLLKLSEDGSSLIASTYVGGSGNDGALYQSNILNKNYGDCFRGEVVVDNLGYIYVASNTLSDNFPVVKAFQNVRSGHTDGVVSKFLPDLSKLSWSSYLGGNGEDVVRSIQVANDYSVFVTGGTSSIHLPGTILNNNGGIDGFVSHIGPTGQLVKSVFLGTGSYDQGYFVQIDSSQNVYILGQTMGAYTTTGNVYKNLKGGQFIHKLSNDLSNTLFSTVFGSGTGSPDISPTAFLVSDCGDIYVSGWGGYWNNEINFVGGYTNNLPVTSDALQTKSDGNDFYIMLLSKNASSLLYATFFGNGVNNHVDGGTSRFDKKGIIYQSVCAGCAGNCNYNNGCNLANGTNHSPFTTTQGSWSQKINSPDCNNGFFKINIGGIRAQFQPVVSPVGNIPFTTGCAPDTVYFWNKSQGGITYAWNFGNSDSSYLPNYPPSIYDSSGVYRIRLIASNPITCLQHDTAFQTITISGHIVKFPIDTALCLGQSIQFNVQMPSTDKIKWTPSTYLNNDSLPDPISTPKRSITYNIWVTDTSGCNYSQKFLVALDSIRNNLTSKHFGRCKSSHTVNFINSTYGGEKYTWYFGDGTSSNETSPTHLYADTGTFKVILVSTKGHCSDSDTIPVKLENTFIPNVMSPNGDGKNEAWVTTGLEGAKLEVSNRWGQLVFKEENYQNNWVAKDLPDGMYFFTVTTPENETCKSWVQVIR